MQRKCRRTLRRGRGGQLWRHAGSSSIHRPRCTLQTSRSCSGSASSGRSSSGSSSKKTRSARGSHTGRPAPRLGAGSGALEVKPSKHTEGTQSAQLEARRSPRPCTLRKWRAWPSRSWSSRMCTAQACACSRSPTPRVRRRLAAARRLCRPICSRSKRQVHCQGHYSSSGGPDSDPRPNDGGGSFAAGRARKSLSLTSRLHNSS